MTKLNKNTKRAKSLIDNYNNAKTTQLNEIYKNASNYKWRAYYNILEDCKNNNGYDVKCFGANCSTFTMAYTYIDNGQKILKYFTAYNTYIIEL